MNPTRTSPARRRFTLVLTVLLLASLACVIPNFGSPTPTPTAAGTEIPTAAPAGAGKPLQQQELPPVLVETDPPPGAEVAPLAELTFFFNQAMDRPSVESALQGQPPLSGRFEWLDDATVRFISDQPFPAGAEMRLTFAASALAANGLALQEPVELSFRVADSLRVAERIPLPGTPDANPAAAVVVTFNRPVVPLGADAAGLPAAFTLEPQAPGRGEWLNTSTYIFYPEPALGGGVTYSVALDPNLTSSDGVPLSLEGLEPQEWSFTTALPRVTTLLFGERDRLELDGEVTVGFNQPMDRASVEANLRFVDPAGSSVPLRFTWSEDSTQVTFQAQSLLARGARYTVALSAAARSLGGAEYGSEYAYPIDTTPSLAVESTSPASGERLNATYGQAFYLINLTAPLARQDFSGLVTVNPAVSNLRISSTFDRYGLTVEGSFQPSTSYTITLGAGLRDKWDGTLGEPVTLQVTTETPPPSLVIPVSQIGAPAIFIPAGQTSLDVRVTNLRQVQLERRSVTVDDFTAMYYGSSVKGTGLQRWVQPFDIPADRSVSEQLSLDPSGGGLQPGLYSLQVNAPGLNDQSNRVYLLVASNIHLTMKLSQRQAVVWAVDLTQQAPVEGLAVRLLDANANQLATCITLADGVCSAELPARKDLYEEVYATSGQPGEAQFAFVSRSMSQGASAWEMGIPSELEGDRDFVYMYSDRPIYRPGQTVSFKVVLQRKENARYHALDLGEVEVRVMPPYDYSQPEQNPLTTLRLPVSAIGTAEGSFDLPLDAQPGYYSLNIDEPYANLGIQVAEYRKPEFDLQVNFAQPEYQAGDALTARVNAQYYFGAPVNDLPVYWQLYARTDWVFLPERLQAGAYDDSWLYPPGMFAPSVGQFVASGQAQTGADGTLLIELPADTYADLVVTNRRTLTIEISSMDESNMPVSARAEATLHPSSFYIGVRPDAWSVQAGEELGYTIQALDWAGQPAGQHNLRAVFSRVAWVTDDGEATPYGIPTYRKELTEIASSDLRTDTLGRARVAFTPPDSGTYQLDVSGDGALTQALSWVSGPGMAPWPTLPNQRLQLQADAEGYDPGDTATIRIPNPYGAGAQALVSVERSRVMRAYVVQIDESLYEFELPIEAIDAPNIYVSVVLLGRAANGQPDFRQGILDVTVHPSALLLNLEASFTPPQAGPAETVRLDLRVTGADGRPAQGEFSLALVDKAVLALAAPNSQNIIEAFYGRQYLAVHTSLNMTAFSGRAAVAELGRGGGGGDMAVTPGARTRFEDTALWVGSFETNPDGVAAIDIALPDNLTTWVADIRGLTTDARVGGASAEIIATRDLLVRPVTPRFLVVGDHVQFGAVVQNNTGQQLSVDVSLQAPGLTLDDSNTAVQKVDVPANGRRRVDWWVTVQDVAAVDPVFRAASGNLEDATHTEGGSLPVIRYTASQTYATAGMLTEQGQRLEVVSLPRTFTPTGGELRVELTPSLASTMLQGLEALEAFPDDFTEPVISRLLANAAAYRALKDFGLEAPDLQSSLEREIRQDLSRLLTLQHYDGGWNWGVVEQESDRRLTAYALVALSQAAQADFFVNPDALSRGQAFLNNTLITPLPEMDDADLDLEALVAFSLQTTGAAAQNTPALYDLREKLSPWGKAMLALVLESSNPGDERARSLISDLSGLAVRSATGANWQAGTDDWRSWATPVFTTAVVSYALATIDPASTLLTDSIRYLVLHRRPTGSWWSSYDSAWALLALSQALKSTGDLQASFNYQADLNGALLANGSADGPQGALNPVNASVPLSQLVSDGSNALQISRDAGAGRLYYRAYLEVGRSAADAPAYSRGVFIEREYFRAGVDCREQACEPVTEAELGDMNGLLVRLTVTLPTDMYYLVVEDAIPAGTEVINPNLKTSRQGFVTEELPAPENDLIDPFRSGWGWWWFGDAKIHDDSVRWIAPFLPAGAYTLTYRLSPVVAGEFQTIPAQAYMYYFPEVEGRSAGGVLTIR